MNDQLKTFLSGLLYQLVDFRMQPRELRGHYQDWSKWGRISGRIDLAAELGLIAHDQWVDLHRLLSSASDCLGMPFPHQGNAGPLMSLRVAHDRRQAAAKPPVQAVTFDAVPAVTYMGGYDFVDAGQAKPHVQAAEPFVDEAEYFEPCPACEGNGEEGFAPCSLCAGSARVPVDAKPQAQGSTNDRSCAVSPAPAASQGLRLPGLLRSQSAGQDIRISPSSARRELRLLCVLREAKLGVTQAGYLPIHTMHRLPPRAMVTGKWSQPRYAGLYLRETHSTVPTGAVLERCERHRQAHAFRAPCANRSNWWGDRMTVSLRARCYLLALLLNTLPCLLVGVLIGYLAAAVVAMNVMQSFDKLQKAIGVVVQQCAPSDPANATDAEQIKGRAPGLSEHAPPFGQTEARAERTLEHPPP